MGNDAKAGRQRMTAALVIKAKEVENRFDVFLSHNSKDKAGRWSGSRRRLARRWDSARGWTSGTWRPAIQLSDALEQAIQNDPVCTALCFGPADAGRLAHHRAAAPTWRPARRRQLAHGLLSPAARRRGWRRKCRCSCSQTLWVDMRDWESETERRLLPVGLRESLAAPRARPRSQKRFGARDVVNWQELSA